MISNDTSPSHRQGDLARLDQDGTSVLCSHRWRDGIVCPEVVAERFYIVAQSRDRWPLTMEPEDWRAAILRFPHDGYVEEDGVWVTGGQDCLATRQHRSPRCSRSHGPCALARCADCPCAAGSVTAYVSWLGPS